MKASLLAIAALALCSSAFAQSMSCPSGTEDMMNYFTMGDPNRLTNFMAPGNANPIYTSIVPDFGASFANSGYFLWIKSWIGYPWDVKTFDQNYVYDRTTELSWTDPTTFKRFDVDLPMTPRCVPLQKSGRTIRILSKNTNYSSYSNCQSTLTQNLGYVINSVSAPVTVNAGGNLGNIKTRYFKYKYSCDANYSNCAYQEVFSLGYQVGLYDWKYYKNSGRSFKLVQESVINQFNGGSATPYMPCTSSYQ